MHTAQFSSHTFPYSVLIRLCHLSPAIMGVTSDPEKTKMNVRNEYAKDEGYDDALLLAAEAAAAEVYLWTKRMLQLYQTLIVPCFCGCLNGYDGSLMGGINE